MLHSAMDKYWIGSVDGTYNNADPPTTTHFKSPVVDLGGVAYVYINGVYYEGVCRAYRNGFMCRDNRDSSNNADYHYLIQFRYAPDESVLHYEWYTAGEFRPAVLKNEHAPYYYNMTMEQINPKKFSSIKKGGNNKNKAKSKKKKENEDEIGLDDNDSNLKIPIPAPIRKRLLDEWTMVNTEKTVVPLPRKPSVSEILTEFFVSSTSTRGMDILPDDFTRLFNVYLGLALLYRHERPQYEEQVSQRGVSMASVYGAEHLLRMCVKFNESPALIPVVLELTMYLKDNMTTLFLDEYCETDDNYFIKLYS